VHPLVEVGFLGVDVAVEVDDAEVATVQVFGDGSGGRKTDRVVATRHHRKGAAGVDVPDRLEIWSNVFSMSPGMVKTSPRSARVTDSRRSTPNSELYGPYNAEILRMP